MYIKNIYLDTYRMQARYSKVALPDGTVRRVSRNIKQLGGAARPTEDIDRDFDSTEPRMSLVWNERKGEWEPSAASWYDMLRITPEYIVEKCDTKGESDKETKEIIRRWGNEVIDISPTGKLTGDAVLGARQRTRDLPQNIKNAHEAYLNNEVKQGERNGYQNCRLLSHDLRALNHMLCEGLLGNPQPYGRPITSEEILREALEQPDIPDERKKKLTECYRANLKGVARARDNGNGRTGWFRRADFTHITNSGAGDCLFIAFTNYMSIVYGQLDGIFPSPLYDTTGLPRIMKPQEDKKAADEVRQRVVDWLNANRRLVLPLGVTIEDELAVQSAEGGTGMRLNIQELLKNFGRNHRVEWNNFGFTGNLKNDKDLIITAFNNPIGYLEKHPKALRAINILKDIFANAYLSNMRRRSTYAGFLEIVALSHLFNVNIHALQKSSENSYESYMGSTVDDPLGDVYLIFTLNVEGTDGSHHFEVMFPVPSPAPKPEAKVQVQVQVPVPVQEQVQQIQDDQDDEEVQVVQVKEKKPQPKKPNAPTKRPREQQQQAPIQPKLMKTKFSVEDHKFLTKLGFKYALPSMSADKVEKFFNDLFMKEKSKADIVQLLSNNMEAIDRANLSEVTKNIVYNFIERCVDRDKNLALLLPILIIRGDNGSDPISNWEKYIIDERLNQVFQNVVERLCSEMIADNSFEVSDDSMISGRLRDALARGYNEPERNIKVNTDELMSLSIMEMYEVANSFVDDKDTLPIKAYYFREFLESFYFHSITIIAAISRQPPLVPGINQPVSLEAVANILNVFGEYIELNNN
jgi:hypothetical protein